MAWSHVQSAAPTTTSGSLTVTPTAGNLLIVTATNGASNSPPTLSDSAGNTWAVLNPYPAGTVWTTQSWYAVANGSSSTTITTSGFALMYDEFSGQAASSPADQHLEFSTPPATTTYTIGPVTVTANDELVWSAYTIDEASTGSGSGFSAGANFEPGAYNFRTEYAFLSGGSGSSQSATWALSNSGGQLVAFLATFKPGSGGGGGGTATQRLALLGVGA